MKWKASDYDRPFQRWKAPSKSSLVYPCSAAETRSLKALSKVFKPLAPYLKMEKDAAEHDDLVSLELPVTSPGIAFLENTAEQCTSPQTKHSRKGMQSARSWLQRVGTETEIYQRLTDGYGISLMFGERCHQYIRNSNNWRGISGCLLDIDVFKDEEHPNAPEPLYSREELFERYALLPRILSFLLPSANSLYEGRSFKARGILFFPYPVTDQRVYRAFGDILCRELDCIPQNVTKTPVAVGFGNTHNAPQVYRGESDAAWIAGALEEARARVISESRERRTRLSEQQKRKAKRKTERQKQKLEGSGEGENISAFIDNCDPVAEMVSAGWLTPVRQNEYRWHESGYDRSCTVQDGAIRIYSNTMMEASPHVNPLEAVGTHRFYLYQLCNLDMTRKADRKKIRQFLFENGYGSDPAAYKKERSKEKEKSEVAVKLRPKPLEKVLEPLEKAREFLAEFLKSAAPRFALRTDTGTGKTETAIAYATKSEVVLGVGNTNLAMEVTERAEGRGIDAFRFRGIEAHPPTSDDLALFLEDGRSYFDDGYLSCMHSERFVILRNKGYNPYVWVCGSCQHQDECKSVGYLSQPEQAKKARLVALPFPTAFLDPRLRSFAKLYQPKGKNALIFHDDIPIGRLFIEVSISQARLRQIAADWSGTDVAVWAKVILKCIAERNWEALKAASSLEAELEEMVIEALTHVLDPSTGIVEDPEDFIKLPHVDITTADACRELPAADTLGFDTFTLLKKFWSRYPRVEDAPFFYSPPSETFVFSLPAEPYADKRKTLKMGFAAATLDKTLMEKIFPGIAFYDTNATEWVEGAEFYQLESYFLPRATVLLPETERAETCLSESGEGYYERVISFIKEHPDEKHAVFSYKCVIDEKQSELDALGVVSGWYGNFAGLDTSFKDVKYFHVLFAPYVQPFDINMLAKQIFGQDTDPLLRDENGDLARDAEGIYSDPRVRKIFEALVVGEVLQAFGRARLNLYPNTVIFWSALDVDTASNRPGVVCFNTRDWDRAENDLQKLASIVSDRKAAAQSTDVKAIAEAEGVSERTARRRTQQTRKQKNAESDLELRTRAEALLSLDLSLTQTAADLGISRRKLDRILNTQIGA